MSEKKEKKKKKKKKKKEEKKREKRKEKKKKEKKVLLPQDLPPSHPRASSHDFSSASQRSLAVQASPGKQLVLLKMDVGRGAGRDLASFSFSFSFLFLFFLFFFRSFHHNSIFEFKVLQSGEKVKGFVTFLSNHFFFFFAIILLFILFPLSFSFFLFFFFLSFFFLLSFLFLLSIATAHVRKSPVQAGSEICRADPQEVP